jgi:hypothetical protein
VTKCRANADIGHSYSFVRILSNLRPSYTWVPPPLQLQGNERGLQHGWGRFEARRAGEALLKEVGLSHLRKAAVSAVARATLQA